jgi:hypothetical protein
MNPQKIRDRLAQMQVDHIKHQEFKLRLDALNIKLQLLTSISESLTWEN